MFVDLVEVVDAGEKRDLITTREERENAHYLLVLNKCALPRHADWNDSDAVAISCHERSGLEELTRAIGEELSLGVASWGQEAVAVNARHQECLRRSREGVLTCRDQLSRGVSPEFAAVDLRISLEAIGEVAGKVETEELLGEIFGSFCIGK